MAVKGGTAFTRLIPPPPKPRVYTRPKVRQAGYRGQRLEPAAAPLPGAPWRVQATALWRGRYDVILRRWQVTPAVLTASLTP